jgi:hypothetical protein
MTRQKLPWIVVLILVVAILAVLCGRSVGFRCREWLALVRLAPKPH